MFEMINMLMGHAELSMEKYGLLTATFRSDNLKTIITYDLSSLMVSKEEININA